MAKRKVKDKNTVKSEFQEELLRLKDQQNRSGKKTLTTEQRCRILNQIYDGTLFALQSAIMLGINRGTSAAVHLLERSRLEMIELQRADLEIARRQDGEQHTMAYEFDLPEMKPEEKVPEA